MRGPKPKSNTRKIAEGDPNKIGKQKLLARLRNEPNATYGLPECPEYLGAVAREAWEFWAVELADMNQDRRPDAPMLAGACINYEAFIEAYKETKRLGQVVEEPIVSRDTGEIIGYKLKKNPWVEVRNKTAMIYKAFCSEFPLSPVSRTRLSVDRQEKTESLAEILSRPREERPGSTVQ